LGSRKRRGGLLKARTGASVLRNGYKTRGAQQAKAQPSKEALRVTGRIVRIRNSGKVAFAAKPTCENLDAKHRQQEATSGWTRCGAGVFKERSVEKTGDRKRCSVTGCGLKRDAISGNNDAVLVSLVRLPATEKTALAIDWRCVVSVTKPPAKPSRFKIPTTEAFV
jgi:hypothetical protein